MNSQSYTESSPPLGSPDFDPEPSAPLPLSPRDLIDDAPLDNQEQAGGAGGAASKAQHAPYSLRTVPRKMQAMSRHTHVHENEELCNCPPTVGIRDVPASGYPTAEAVIAVEAVTPVNDLNSDLYPDAQDGQAHKRQRYFDFDDMYHRDGRIMSFFGAVSKSGVWYLPFRYFVGCIFGSLRLDIRKAVFPPSHSLRLFCFNLFGQIRIILPEDVHLEEKSIMTLGSWETDVNKTAAARPTGFQRRVILVGCCIFGSVRISYSDQPPRRWTDYE